MTSTSSQLQAPQDLVVAPISEILETDHSSSQGSRSFWSSIRLKATLAAIAIGTLPVVAIGGVAYYFANKSITEQIGQAELLHAEEVTNTINRFIFERYGDIQIVASLDILTDAKSRASRTLAEKEAILERFEKTYGVYDSIAVFDLNGDLQISSGGKPFKNHKDRIYFQEALKNNSPFISEPSISTTSGTFNVYFAAPVKDAQTGKTIAIVRSRMPVKYLDNLLSRNKASRGEYYLLNNSKEVFIGPKGIYASKSNTAGQTANEPNAEFTAISVQSIFPDLQQIATNRSATAIAANKDSNKEQLIGLATTGKFEGMPQLNWGAIVTTDTNVAFAPQQQLLLTLLIGIGITTLLVAAIAAYLARLATRPILNASEVVEKVGQGDLDIRIEAKGDDELAQLGGNINQMASRIKALLEEAGASDNRIQLQNQMLLESEALQADVGHILDVVSAVEEGDLTVEAEVSDRATGLVADTLNRLIEELAKTMGVVLATSQQIDRSADDLKQLAASAAQQVELQTQSVVQAQALMSNVNEISQDTAEQALQSNAAIQAAQAAVSQGQQEISAMNKGVMSLQEGAEQIVKRTQSLAEFVASAAQFTNDQKRVASLTRVLALNASMIAARASAQQDPEQFASVAKEFETIANQVNELAVQTNQSLVLLQQRTDRIQTVVSGVDEDVQEITGLVEDFTQGVERSRQVLNNIQAVTEQVAQTGAQVTQSSQAIAEAARNTLGRIDDIASVATQTEQQSRFTRDKAEGMDRLARVLLETVQVFRLPSNLQEDETVAKALSFTSKDDTEPDLVKIS